jgi:hypothetical protein
MDVRGHLPLEELVRLERIEKDAARSKRLRIIRPLETNGCEFLREGRKHTIYVNRADQVSGAVPRHREINEFLTRKICRDPHVPQPGKRQ